MTDDLERRVEILELAVLALGATEEFGDTPGHEFRGNQYTGGGSAKRAENNRVERRMNEVHKVMASDRQYRAERIAALKTGETATIHVGAGTGARFIGTFTGHDEAGIHLKDGYFETNTVDRKPFAEKTIPNNQVRDAEPGAIAPRAKQESTAPKTLMNPEARAEAAARAQAPFPRGTKPTGGPGGDPLEEAPPTPAQRRAYHV